MSMDDIPQAEQFRCTAGKFFPINNYLSLPTFQAQAMVSSILLLMPLLTLICQLQNVSASIRSQHHILPDVADSGTQVDLHDAKALDDW